MSDPVGGVIDRDAARSPVGNAAGDRHAARAATRSRAVREEWEQAILDAQRTLHALGITACQEASLDEALFAPYRAVAERGELTMRTEGNLLWRDDAGDEVIEELLERRAQRNGRAPPAPGSEAVPGRRRRELHGRDARAVPRCRRLGDREVRCEPVRARAAAADRRAARCAAASRCTSTRSVTGLCVSRSTRSKPPRRSNGRRDARHHLAHVQFVDPADLPRFGELGVVANVTPYWAVLSGYVRDLTLPFVSAEAGASMYPFASILRAGGRLAFGSDWTVSTPDPLLQLEVAVTRRRPGQDGDEPLLPNERLTLDEAITAATMGSAYVNHRDHDTGSIEPGKLADLVVLDRDLLDRGAGAIGEARVVTTLVEGDVVYENSRRGDGAASPGSEARYPPASGASWRNVPRHGPSPRSRGDRPAGAPRGSAWRRSGRSPRRGPAGRAASAPRATCCAGC